MGEAESPVRLDMRCMGTPRGRSAPAPAYPISCEERTQLPRLSQGNPL